MNPTVVTALDPPFPSPGGSVELFLHLQHLAFGATGDVEASVSVEELEELEELRGTLLITVDWRHRRPPVSCGGTPRDPALRRGFRRLPTPQPGRPPRFRDAASGVHEYLRSRPEILMAIAGRVFTGDTQGEISAAHRLR
ncbi:hypothetical protein [Streptomyces sp. NRRL B-24572]|uniref:hypothetical protein n=1 Tax=Streptomyces sp. NRRL B-24572 TaxID=1962156 RepID=UPI00117DB53B|nr:hypothetical protein [Streptomyces sp. NRRL B-24572]